MQQPVQVPASVSAPASSSLAPSGGPRSQVHQSTRRAVWAAYLPAAAAVLQFGHQSPQAQQACAQAVGAFQAAASIRQAAGLPPLESSAVWQAAQQRARAKLQGRRHQ